jgi:hypothetical protein
MEISVANILEQPGKRVVHSNSLLAHFHIKSVRSKQTVWRDGGNNSTEAMCERWLFSHKHFMWFYELAKAPIVIFGVDFPT